MRDLLDLLENLQIINEESRGLLFRAEGDKFFKGNNDSPERVLVFNKADYYPSAPGEYESHEEMLKALDKIKAKLPNIAITNTPRKNHKAFALLSLTDEETNQPFYSLRFFKEIKPKMAGAWENYQLTEVPREYQLQKSTSLKHTYQLKPSDIFPPPASFKNVNELMRAFENSPKAKSFVPGFKMMYGKNPEFPEFENAGQYFSAIRDDLGEIIGPIALIQGLDMGNGAEQAREDLLGKKGSWAGSSISFPSSKTNNLVDSYIVTSSGVEVGLSSKGGRGAQASTKNLLDGIQYIRSSGSPAQKKYLTKFKDQVELINKIATTSSIDLPIYYGIEKGIISSNTGAAIRILMQRGESALSSFNKSVQREIEKLHAGRDANKDNPGYNSGFHALAALAAMVARDINTDPAFSEACMVLLNASPVIQLHIKTSKQADDTVRIDGFKSTYPPNFSGKVELSHDKNYSATNASGRLTFLYNEKSGSKKDDEERASSSRIAAIPIEKAASAILGKKLTKRPAKRLKTEPNAGVGRAKRKK